MLFCPAGHGCTRISQGNPTAEQWAHRKSETTERCCNQTHSTTLNSRAAAPLAQKRTPAINSPHRGITPFTPKLRIRWRRLAGNCRAAPPKLQAPSARAFLRGFAPGEVILLGRTGPEAPGTLDLRGRTTLAQAAVIIAACRAYVGIDLGLMWIRDQLHRRL